MPTLPESLVHFVRPLGLLDVDLVASCSVAAGHFSQLLGLSQDQINELKRSDREFFFRNFPG